MHRTDNSLNEKNIDREDDCSSSSPEVSLWCFVGERFVQRPYPPLKKIWAARTMPRGWMKIQIMRKIHVTVRTMQKSNMRSDRRNLCPRFAFARYIEMCVAAPPMNIIMKTMVSGKSTVEFGGLPPRKPPSAGSTVPPGGGPSPGIRGASAAVSD